MRLFSHHQRARMDIETENRAVLVMINQADQFYREQQRLAKAMRKVRQRLPYCTYERVRGFAGLFGSRQSSQQCWPVLLDLGSGLPRRAAGAIRPQFVRTQFLALDDHRARRDDISSVSITSLEATDAWRKDIGVSVDQPLVNTEKLRRRGAESQVMTMSTSNDEPNSETDTVLLFTALAPPTLRKAKREFLNGKTIDTLAYLKLSSAQLLLQLSSSPIPSSESKSPTPS